MNPESKSSNILTMKQKISARTGLQRSEIFTIMAGGLGNQFFQLAAAIHVASGRRILIDWRLGRPRVNSTQHPEITSFSWPDSIHFSSKPSLYSRITRPTYFARKAVNYFFKESEIIGVENKTAILRCLMNLFIKIYFRKAVSFQPAEGSGYFQMVCDSKISGYVGYFQSFRWASDPKVFSVLKKTKLNHEGNKYLNYKSLILKEKPVIIHVRRGDYKAESDFGLIPQEYFFNAVNLLAQPGSIFWVFSDDPSEAAEILDFLPAQNVRYVKPEELSASETLQLMRYGHGYVLSNSTFGWWAAFLKENDGANVIAPSPWFKSKASPLDLIPPEWRTINPWK